MSEHETKSSMPRRPSNVIELLSDEESPGESSSGGNDRRESIIEVLSDEEGGHEDDDLQIVGESETAEPEDDDIQITGQNQMVPPIVQYPGATFQAVPVDINRVQRSSTATPAPPIPPPRYPQGSRQRPQRRRGRFLADAIGSSTVDYLYSFARLPVDQQVSLFNLWHESETRDDISGAIMARLEREDESALDRKIEREKIYNRQMLQKKRQEAKDSGPMHTTNISPDVNLLCELCGIQLGEGIPDDFTPNPKYNDKLEKHAVENKVQAPWFCLTQCLVADRDLSKRSFVAKCGHVFCGRCIKNIGNRPAGRRTKKQEREITIDNPAISAPRKCPAEGCSHHFSRGKRAFVELFL